MNRTFVKDFDDGKPLNDEDTENHGPIDAVEVASPENLDQNIYHDGHPDLDVLAGSNGITFRNDSEDIPGDPIQTSLDITEEEFESIEEALNMTPTNHNEPAETLNTTTTLQAAPSEKLNNITQVLDNASTPSPPIVEADNSTVQAGPISAPMHISEDSSKGSSEGSLENEHRRRTHHIRNNTVTLPSPENALAKEIADVLNELVNSPPDSLIAILQNKFTELAMDKETQWREEAEKAGRRAEAAYEMKKQAVTAAAAVAQPVARPPSRPPSPAIDIERVIRERDQSREHAASSARTLRELFKQQELLMDKERSHQEHIKHVQKEMEETNAAINEVHMRYTALLAEAEEELLQADVGVSTLQRELDDSIATLRFKVRQQDMTIRSLQATVESLQTEKKELLDICDDLVARTEATHTQQIVDNREF